jgi:hypothetical protein
MSAPVSIEMPDRDRVVLGHTPGSATGCPYSLPQWNWTTTMSAICRTLDARLQRDSVDRAADSVECDEAELDAAHIDDRDRSQAGAEDAVLLQELVGEPDPLRPVVRGVVVGQARDVRAH